MAAQPGEESVATLFGDVHYFYGDPNANPPHHRFDKGSYVYLFENANDRRARVEIANQPGTDHQDAFDGFLDQTCIKYSYKQQVVVSITVDAVPGATLDLNYWHLPTYDPRNENKYHYKLQSLDIYFWTQGDALRFVNGVRRVLPASQVEVLDEPGPPPRAPPSHAHDVNPLVSKLESAAMTDPDYGKVQPPAGAPSFAPPPVTAVRGSSDSPPAFQPMAYNPAAPAAPEQIRHREKTPPPLEEDGADPLHAAVARDHSAPGYGINGPLSPGFPGPPGPPTAPHPGVSSPGFPPPQFGGLVRSSTVPVTGIAYSGLTSSHGSNISQSSGAGPHPLPPPPNPHFQPRGSPSPAPSATRLPQPLASPGLPPGGYSNFNYGHQSSNPQAGDYSIHQQVYRPTEEEHNVKFKPKPEGRSKLGENADRLERGVTGMLKKFEKRFG